MQQTSPVSHVATPPLLGGKLLGKLEDVCAVAYAVADHGNHVHGSAHRPAGRGDLSLEAANLRTQQGNVDALDALLELTHGIGTDVKLHALVCGGILEDEAYHGPVRHSRRA